MTERLIELGLRTEPDDNNQKTGQDARSDCASFNPSLLALIADTAVESDNLKRGIQRLST